ncbi:MAG: amidohydrolase [Micavibrio sp. TMED27]|nr:amidohydrolase [Micavibrio sp.]OUT90852.1 MAG: amidohydrolase [Micavibrio sp. TMED27]
MSIRNSIHAIKDEISTYRRLLHENPQTAYEETFAAELIASKLTEWGVDFERGIAVTGIVATIEGQTNKSGRTIGLRADMDALDIIEEGNKAHISKTSGKMHGCGHDGHTACLLGAAKYLSENRNFDGKVHLIFQPAEEGYGGAHKMIEEGLFERFPMDSVYGLHNWPKLPKGEIALRSGPIMAAADRFDIRITGAGGHAAMPHRTNDPIIVGTHLVQALQTLVSRSVDPLDSAVISITNFNAGTGAFNVIPDTAELNGTLRSFLPETRAALIKRIEEMTHSVAALYGAKAECVFMEGGYNPTVNTHDETAFCADIARELVGQDNVDTEINPSMGAEDFGAMLQKVPGCYIWMGQGEADENSHHNQGLHTPLYDFNDEIIPQAVEYWVRVVEGQLPVQ